MDFNINTLIDTMSKMTKGKFVLYATIEISQGFKSIKYKRVSLVYCPTPKTNKTIFTCQITAKMNTEDEIKVVDKALSKELSAYLIKYIMSDEFKELVNG